MGRLPILSILEVDVALVDGFKPGVEVASGVSLGLIHTQVSTLIYGLEFNSVLYSV